MSVSRVVVLLSPLFVALSGYVVTQASRLPGAPKLNPDELTGVFIAGALAAGGAIVTWLNNRGKHERQEAADAQERARWPQDDDIEVGEFGELLLSDMSQALPQLRKVLGLTAIEADASRALATAHALDLRLEVMEDTATATGVVAAAQKV